MGKRQNTEQAWTLPAGWVHRLALFLVGVLLVLYLGALLAHLFAGAAFYVTAEVDLYQVATSILALILWLTAIIFVSVAVQRGYPLVAEPWRRWPWICRAAVMLAASALVKHIAILVSRASLPAATHLETLTLLLSVAGWATMALALLRGETPLAGLFHEKARK